MSWGSPSPSCSVFAFCTLSHSSSHVPMPPSSPRGRSLPSWSSPVPSAEGLPSPPAGTDHSSSLIAWTGRLLWPIKNKQTTAGTSLAVQQSRLHTCPVRGAGSIPWSGRRATYQPKKQCVFLLLLVYKFLFFLAFHFVSDSKRVRRGGRLWERTRSRGTVTHS